MGQVNRSRHSSAFTAAHPSYLLSCSLHAKYFAEQLRTEQLREHACPQWLRRPFEMTDMK